MSRSRIVSRNAVSLVAIALLTGLCVVVSFAAGLQSADLHRVWISSDSDAAALRASSLDPVISLADGYLVLSRPGAALGLEDLRSELIATGVSRDELVIDNRLDRANVGRLPLVFEQDNLRVFRLDPAAPVTADQHLGVYPVGDRRAKIVAPKRLPEKARIAASTALQDLETLISLVERDSLISYTERLQAFYRRVAGTDSNYVSRDWIASRLTGFGYDSVVIDSFQANLQGDLADCQNVLAYKVGTRFPDMHLVIGAHRDGVPGSPAADDNGSGTAAVMEMARVLQGYETDMTIIFALFDAEEFGLFGAEHYVNEAQTAGDSIVYMFNMDMIGFIDNTNQAKLFHGPDTRFSERCLQLADSLVGIAGALVGTSGASDHFPFQQAGIPVTFLHEFVFSNVYHSFQDSTTYIDFDYMTNMVRAGLATCYYISQTEGPIPRVTFDYPDGLPISIYPGVEESFTVQFDGVNQGSPVTGSANLHYTINGAPTEMRPLTHLGDELYEFTLPAIDCGDSLAYYFSVEEAVEGVQYDPPDTLRNPYGAIPATDADAVFADDFETLTGLWTAEGDWQIGTPIGGGGAHGGPDPSDAVSGSDCAGYNLLGDYSPDLPETNFTTPAIDCSAYSLVLLDFYRWLGVEQPLYDHAYVRISNDGSNWTTLWENSLEVTDDSWVPMQFDITEYAAGQETVYIRWVMGPTDDAWQFCGWNIDDVVVRGYACSAIQDSDSDGVADAEDNCPDDPNPLQEDTDNDGLGDACCCISPTVGNYDRSPGGTVDLGDLTVLIDHLFVSLTPIGCPTAGNIDMSPDGEVTLVDLTVLIDHLFISLSPLEPCP
ncbi:M28 family peptidase [candidate division GN15 bacterium]|nr:M28 family peptidase [candidate division GN15 bacterium]